MFRAVNPAGMKTGRFVWSQISWSQVLARKILGALKGVWGHRPARDFGNGVSQWL